MTSHFLLPLFNNTQTLTIKNRNCVVWLPSIIITTKDSNKEENIDLKPTDMTCYTRRSIHLFLIDGETLFEKNHWQKSRVIHCF